jgi:hypothetical protein
MRPAYRLAIITASSYKNGHAGGNVNIKDSTDTLRDRNLLISSSGCAAALFGASIENNGSGVSSAEVQNVTLKIEEKNMLAAS